MAFVRHLGFFGEPCTTNTGPLVVGTPCKSFIMIGLVVFKL